MDRRFEWRLDEMMEQAEVSPELLKDVLPRVCHFLGPFLQSLSGPSQTQHAVEYTTGLMSGLKHKTGEGIAYLYDQDRQGIQKFIGQAPWDHQPMLCTLAAEVGTELREPDGVIVFDPSAFPKKGDKSVGVAKQWCGRLGKVENCQVAVYMTYVTRKEHAIVNTRLYLPKDWAKDRQRRKEAGVPRSIEFRTRQELATQIRKIDLSQGRCLSAILRSSGTSVRSATRDPPGGEIFQYTFRQNLESRNRSGKCRYPRLFCGST